ncbi:MAG: hypothetical protein JSV08_01685 [Acidobacteriota bacterium]|nr:MAG: hypothetical protein JSV08_01685 [Acidobacteriota bacterium]
MKKIAVCIAMLAAATLAFAQAAPPDLVNFQGVLRDSADAPLDGAYDMVFRFFDDPAAGEEILVDSHEAAGSGAVTVTGGLFNVSLGSGTVTDGSGPSGTYTTLTDMFRDYSAVYVEVQVGADPAMTPRIQVVSAAYALNAGNVGGVPPGNFLRSDVDDTAEGRITFNQDIDVLGGTVNFDMSGTELTGYSDRFELSRKLDVFGEVSGWRFCDWLCSYYLDPGDPTSGSLFGNLQLGDGSAADDDYLYFDATAEYLRWSDVNNRFEFSNDVYTSQSLFSSSVYSNIFYDANNASYYVDPASTSTSGMFAGDIQIGYGVATDDDSIYFDTSATPEYLRWVDAQNRFQLSNDLSVLGSLDLGAGADDDLTATDVEGLTGGLDTTLHSHDITGDITGTGDGRYLRKDIADTAAGVITFSAATTDVQGSLVDTVGTVVDVGDDLYVQGGNVGAGAAPNNNYAVYGTGSLYGGYFEGTRWGIRSKVTESSTTTLNGVEINVENTGIPETAMVYGIFNTTMASGAKNGHYVYGMWTAAGGDSESTGPHYGVWASAGGGTGKHYGVFGRAGGGDGLQYGVYGEVYSGDGTGDRHGVYGSVFDMTSSNDHYGVKGEAVGSGKNIGGHFLASNGTENWSIYAVTDVFVGGKLDFGADADDDFKASDATTLTGGGNADTLHGHDFTGAGDVRYLRKDIADTAAGVIKFTATTTDVQSSLVDTVDSEVDVGDDLHIDGGTLGIGISPNAGRSIYTSGLLYGAYFRGLQYGAYLDVDVTSSGSIYGLQTLVRQNDVVNTSPVYGTHSKAQYLGANNPDVYGVWGEAAGSGSATSYGVYGTAAGAGNWGLYTPDAAHVGGNFDVDGNTILGSDAADTVTFNAVVSGGIDFGAGADDDLTASDVTELTDGFDTTLHSHDITGAGDARYLRKDVDDTAAGNIAFNQSVGVGVSPVADWRVDSTYGSGATGYGAVRGQGANAPTKGYLGVQGATDFDGVPTADWSGQEIGVAGISTGSTNTDNSGVLGHSNYTGVRGEAIRTDGLDTLHGVYGTASGGSTNYGGYFTGTTWGLYTPDNVGVGDNLSIGRSSSTDNDYLYFDADAEFLVWIDGLGGVFDFSDDVIPNNADTFDLGSTAYYWNLVYADGFRYKTAGDADWLSFDTYPDLDLIDGMNGIPVTNRETGEVQLVVDPATIPAIIRGTPTPDDPTADQFVDVKKADSLLFGAVRELRREGKGREAALRDELNLRTPDKETGRQEMDGNLQIALDKDANDAARFSVFRDGEDGLQEEVFRLDEEGNLYLKGSVRPASLDLAEYHPISETVEAGDVLVMDPQNPSVLQRCAFESDPRVVGIVSAAPGVELGRSIRQIAAMEPELAARIDDARAIGDKEAEDSAWAQLEEIFKATHAAVALSGTVACKVDAGYGAVEAGDLLVASPTPGHAMRADTPVPGTILGKAMGALDAGTGMVKVLVMLR